MGEFATSALIMRGSTGCEVPTVADAIESKPLWIDLTPGQGIVDHGPDGPFVIGPEAHAGMEAQKAGLPRTFGEQHVPAPLQGGLSGLEVQLFPGSIKAGENDDRLAGPRVGRGWLQEVARQPHVLEGDLQHLRIPGQELDGFQEGVA